jgi:hypothetical protein
MAKKKTTKSAKPSVGKKTAKATVTVAGGMFSSDAMALAASANKVVRFACTSSLCLVSLQVGLQKATFVGAGQMLLPSGFHQMTVQIQGPSGTAFTLTATGAQMQPIAGFASMAGLVPITV